MLERPEDLAAHTTHGDTFTNKIDEVLKVGVHKRHVTAIKAEEDSQHTLKSLMMMR